MRRGEGYNRGYMLIAVLGLLLGLMGGALSLMAAQHQRLMAERFEILIETIHRARLWSFHFRTHYDEWPTSQDLMEGTEIAAYVRDVQVTTEPAPALKIRLSNDALQARVQPFILGSKLDGDFLHVAVPSPDDDSNPEILRFLERFQPQPEYSSSMLTDLSMQLHDLVSVGAVSANALAYIGTLWATQGDLASAHFVEMKAQSVFAGQSTAMAAHGNQFETTSVIGQVSSISELTVEQANIRDAWYQAQVHAGEASFTTAQMIDANGRVISANRGNIGSIETHKAEISVLETMDLEGRVLMPSSMTTKEIGAPEGVFNQVQSAQFSGDRVVADSIEVKQNLLMQGGVASSIGFAHAGAGSLFDALHACWFDNQWCRAPEAPTVETWNCVGCVQSKSAGQFQASIHVITDLCVHGCDASISVFPGMTTDCLDSAAPPHSGGQFECTIEAQVAAGELRQGELQVRLHSGKNTAVYTELPVAFSWRAASTCAASMHAFPIAQSSPAMMGHVTFPQRTSGETVQVQEFGGSCNEAFRMSAWSCIASAACDGMGEWQNIQGSCWCDELF